MYGLEDLRCAIARHASARRTVVTAVPRLTLIAEPGAVPPFEVVYEPMICFVASGTKRSVAGDVAVRVGCGSMLVSAMEFPVTTAVEEGPYRAAVLHLDEGALTGMLLEMRHAPRPGGSPGRRVPAPAGLSAAAMDEDLVDAVTRLVRLLDRPEDIAVLAPRIEAEILYRLLSGPAGDTLVRLTLGRSVLVGVRTVAGWLRAHLNEPVDVAQLAAMAHLSPASLHRHFKETVGLSPLRYRQQLRLHEARRLLLLGEPASVVATTIGYGSTTQFSREYRRAYGLPPRQDALRLQATEPRRPAGNE